MADVREILAGLELLRLAGFQAPPAWAGKKPGEVATVWAAELGDMPDGDFERAIQAWLRRDTAFYPSTGQLRALVAPAVTDADLGAAGRSAWQTVQAARHKVREHNGRGYQWRSDEHERRFRAHVGPVAWAALETIGGLVAIERAGFVADEGKELSGLESRFVADFRTIAKRVSVGAAPLDRPQIGAAPARAIGADADLAPSVAERLRVHAMRGET